MNDANATVGTRHDQANTDKKLCGVRKTLYILQGDAKKIRKNNDKVFFVLSIFNPSFSLLPSV